MNRGVRGATTVDENTEAAHPGCHSRIAAIDDRAQRNRRRRRGQCPIHGDAGYYGRLSGQGGAHDRLGHAQR